MMDATAALNVNQAALHIVNGWYDEAIPIMTTYLKSAKLQTTAAGIPGISVESPVNYSVELVFQYNSIGCDDAESSEPLFRQTADDTGTSGDSAFFSILPHPISLRIHPTNHGEESAVGDRLFQNLTYAVLFNIALSYQLKSMEQRQLGNDEARERYLRQSLALYDIASEFCVGPLFGMVLANNVGHIHTMLRNLEPAQRCRHHLLSSAFHVVERGDAADAGSHRALDAVVRTVMPLISTTPSAPAA